MFSSFSSSSLFIYVPTGEKRGEKSKQERKREDTEDFFNNLLNVNAESRNRAPEENPEQFWDFVEERHREDDEGSEALFPPGFGNYSDEEQDEIPLLERNVDEDNFGTFSSIPPGSIPPEEDIPDSFSHYASSAEEDSEESALLIQEQEESEVLKRAKRLLAASKPVEKVSKHLRTFL